MADEVIEEFDSDTGEVKRVGDYTFADIPPLGKGSFACVRLAYRPEKIEAPVRFSVTTNSIERQKTSRKDLATRTSSSLTDDEHDSSAVVEDHRSNNIKKKLVNKLSVTPFIKRVSTLMSRSPKQSESEHKNELNHDSESSEEAYLIEETKRKDFWIKKLSRTTSELQDTEKSQREGSTITNYFDDTNFVAIKILQKSLLNNMKSFTRDSKTRRIKKQTALDLVYYEIALMKKIRHPNLLRLHEVLDSQTSDQLYIVLDYCPLGEIMTFDEETKRYSKSPLLKIATFCHACGVNLGKRRRLCVTESKCFDEKHSSGYMVDVLCGLAYLHRHNICHRDLKPENILLDANGHCKSKAVTYFRF